MPTPLAARWAHVALAACATLGSLAVADLPTASAALETIKALDTDGSGKVERNEVEAFAKSQGLSAEEVAEEFKGLDKNGDGELEPEELTSTLTKAEDADTSKDNHHEKTFETDAKSVKKSDSKSESETKDAKESKDSKDSNDSKAGVKPETGLKEKVVDDKFDASAKHQDVEEFPRQLSSSEPGLLSNASAEASEMEADARLQARRTLAQVFAHKAEEVLAQRGKDEEGAAALEKLAESLRANASELVKRAPSEAESAAVDAADAAAKRTLGQAKKLEASAAKAESDAAEKREQALVAMNAALKAQNEMTSFVRRLRAGA